MPQPRPGLRGCCSFSPCDGKAEVFWEDLEATEEQLQRTWPPCSRRALEISLTTHPSPCLKCTGHRHAQPGYSGHPCTNPFPQQLSLLPSFQQVVAHCRLRQLCPQLCQPLPASPAVPGRSQAAPSTQLCPPCPAGTGPEQRGQSWPGPSAPLSSQGNSTISAPCLPAASQGGGKANIGLLFTSFPFREPRPAPPGSICPLLPAGPGSAPCRAQAPARTPRFPSPLLSLRHRSPGVARQGRTPLFTEWECRRSRGLPQQPPRKALTTPGSSSRPSFPALRCCGGMEAWRHPRGSGREETAARPFCATALLSVHPCPQGCQSPGDRGWVRSLG